MDTLTFRYGFDRSSLQDVYLTCGSYRVQYCRPLTLLSHILKAGTVYKRDGGFANNPLQSPSECHNGASLEFELTLTEVSNYFIATM